MAPLTTKYSRNILRYLYADGLNEIALGLFFLGMFGIRWLDRSAGLAAPIASALPLLNAAAFIFLMRVVVERLRERITYPRLGYARYKPRRQNQRMLIALIVLALAALTLQFALGSAGSSSDVSSLVSIGGTAIMGLCWVWAGYSSGLARFYGLAGSTFALPIVLALLKLPTTLLDIPVVIFFQAVMMIILGSWTLLKLLRTPILETENDDV